MRLRCLVDGGFLRVVTCPWRLAAAAGASEQALRPSLEVSDEMRAYLEIVDLMDSRSGYELPFETIQRYAASSGARVTTRHCDALLSVCCGTT